MERRQAETAAQAAGAGHGELATKADLIAAVAGLETRMARQEARIYAALVALFVALVGAVAGVLAIMLP